MFRKLTCISLACALLLGFAAATAQARQVAGTPHRAALSLASADPSHGIPGATVSLTGSGFGASQGSSAVLFGQKTGPITVTGAAATIVSWSDTAITCTVPKLAAQALSIFVKKVTPPVPPYPGSISLSNALAFTVDAPLISVTAPTGTTSHVQGSSLTVSWTTREAVQTGVFGVWVESASYAGGPGKIVVYNGTTSYSTSVTLDVPPGTGYRIMVSYRAMANGAWTDFGYSPGSFTVTGGTALGIYVTAPTGTGSYAVGASLTVSWLTSSSVFGGEWGLWARSAGGNWYIAKLVPAGGGVVSFTTDLTLAVPPGSGYQAIVAYRPTAGSGDWISWGTSPGSFTVIAR